MLSGSGFQVALGYIMRRQHLIFVKILTRILLNKSSKHMREQHVSMSRGMAIKRLNNKFADRVDLFSHLVGDKAHNTTVDFQAAQGSTLVAAGTETTSTFLSGRGVCAFLDGVLDRLLCQWKSRHRFVGRMLRIWGIGEWSLC